MPVGKAERSARLGGVGSTREGGKHYLGCLKGVPWGQPPLPSFPPGAKPAKHSQSTNKPGKGQVVGYLQTLTPVPQPRASASPWKGERFVPWWWLHGGTVRIKTHPAPATSQPERMENPCALHSASVWKQEQWENTALPPQSPGTAPSPATSHQRIPDCFQVSAG